MTKYMYPWAFKMAATRTVSNQALMFSNFVEILVHFSAYLKLCSIRLPKLCFYHNKNENEQYVTLSKQLKMASSPTL